VATYQYRCAQDGDFDVSRPIGMAAPQVRCAACGADAVRVFTSPMLSLASRAIVAAIDRSESTRDQPALVSSLPPGRRRKQPTTARGKPTLQPLPRP
jgi:putative FmdB family regulatory protein